MKWVLSLLSALALVIGPTAGLAHAGVAEQMGVSALNCQHSQGAGTVVSADHVDGPWGVLGAIQLCRNGSYYWAYLVEYEPVPRGAWAIAHLFRYQNGVRNGVWSCNTSGGNGHIEPGQTMCWTPRIYAPSGSITFMATGRDCFGIYDACEAGTVSYGQTARTR